MDGDQGILDFKLSPNYTESIVISTCGNIIET